MTEPAAPGADGSAGLVDVHAHVVVEGAFGRAGRHGPELSDLADGTPCFRVCDYVLEGVRYRQSPFMDLDLRLEAMDRRGIRLQALSPNPLTYFHGIEAPLAAEFCRWHNDAMAELIARAPDRLVGFAQLPMQDPDAAVTELGRSVGELGLVGAYVGTDFGLPFDAPALDELYAALVRHDVPLMIHPAPPGVDGPGPLARLQRLDLDLTVAFTLGESVAVAELVFGGVLDRHPHLDVCLSHGGGATAVLAGRLRRIGAARAWAADAGIDSAESVDERLGRLWFDTHLGDRAAIDLLAAQVGWDRLVPGTNFAGWDDDPDHHPLGDRAEACSQNARRLLRQ